MTVSELIRRLSTLPPNAPVMILDGFNGGGVPREINLGPIAQTITAADVQETADCEDVGAGARVFVIGYGCY